MIISPLRTWQPTREPWTHERLAREQAIALGQAIDISTWKNYGSALNSYLTFVRMHNGDVQSLADAQGVTWTSSNSHRCGKMQGSNGVQLYLHHKWMSTWSRDYCGDYCSGYCSGMPHGYNDMPVEPTPNTLSLFTVYMSHHIKPNSMDTYLSGICQQLEPYFLHVREARKSHLVHRTLQGCKCLRGSPTTWK